MTDSQPIREIEYETCCDHPRVVSETDARETRIICNNCKWVLRGVEHPCEVRRIQQRSHPVWYVNEQHDIEIEWIEAYAWRGVTITISDLEYMLESARIIRDNPYASESSTDE